jgi:hypothetical protein
MSEGSREAMLTLPAAAKRLGVHVETVRRWARHDGVVMESHAISYRGARHRRVHVPHAWVDQMAETTPPRQEVAMLREIARYRREHGRSPTIRELQEALGISSTSVVVRRLDRLTAQGRIRREPRIRRSIRIVGACEPD